MLYIRCPTCRRLLGDKQLYYEHKLAEICKNNENGLYKNQEEVDLEKTKLVNSMGLDRYCCKIRLLTYVRLVDIVK